MKRLQKRLYDYEATPPEGVWESIAAELNNTTSKVVPMKTRKHYTWYYLAAASVLIIAFFLLFNPFRSADKTQFVNNTGTKDSVKENTVIMTVPVDEKKESKNDQAVVQGRQSKGGNVYIQQQQAKEDSEIIALNTPRYITIEGPEGQPVKISSKMATLIDSAETKSSGKPIWHKKINEWKELMKVNTLAPTPGNFLDILELTKTMKDKQ